MLFTQPYSFVRSIDGRDMLITIEPDLLRSWWGDGVGPQTAEGIVEKYLSTIDKMVFYRDKDDGVSAPQGRITLSSLDWEDDEPYDQEEWICRTHFDPANVHVQ